MPVPTLEQPKAGAARQTRPPLLNLSPQGGINIIPRRGWTSSFGGFGGGMGGFSSGPLATEGRLLAFAAGLPQRLSEILGDTHPTVAKAQSNAITMTCAPGSTRLVAYTALPDGRDKRDDAATSEIEDVFKGFGQGVGGLVGLQTKGTLAILHYGLFPLEAIIGQGRTGVVGIGLSDPLSIVFGIDNDPNSDTYGQTIPHQHQQTGRPVPLRTSTFFWHAYHASLTNPYGRAVFAAAVAEALKDLAFDKDISAAVHNSAWKRLVYTYSLTAFQNIATTVLALPEKDIQREADGTATLDGDGNTIPNYPQQEWVNARITEVQAYLSSLGPDDNITVADTGGVDTVDGSDFTGIDPIIERQGYRMVQALDELPTTMGLPKAGAQTYTSAEWAMQAAKYSSLRAAVMEPILAIANLHFQMQGKQITVKAEYDAIRASDDVQDANAESVRTQTRKEWVAMRITTPEDISMELTGSGLPPEDELPELPPAVDPATGQDVRTGTNKQANLPQAGTSAEERDAAKQGKALAG